MKYHINYSVYSKGSDAFLNIKIIAIWYLTKSDSNLLLYATYMTQFYLRQSIWSQE